MKANKPGTIGIIGGGLGGLGGLASACTLAARGYKVVLFEANPWLGGKAAELNEQGFRFDMGPTILTLPSVLRRIFEESGRRMGDYLEMVRLEPQWRSFFEDGTTLDLVSDETLMAQNLDRFAPGGKVSAGYEKFQKLSKRLNDISQRFFFYKSIGGLRDMFNAKNTFNASILSDVLAMRMGRSVAGTIRSHVPDERVAQMLDHYTQYVGSSPLNSPAVLCGIGHMQSDEGVWYPIGGTRAVPMALAKLAAELGVQFRTNTQIKRIVVENGRVAGVVTDANERIELSAVVSNMDAVRTHRELIGGEIGWRFDSRRKYEPACSGVVLYLGLKERCEHVAHHNFVFSRDHEEEFDAIYHRGEPAPRPKRSRRLRRTAARRCMFWFTRRICVRTTTGKRCFRSIDARSSKNSSAQEAWRTLKSASYASARSRRRTFTTGIAC